MALTETTPIPLGYKAPNFNLPDTISGKTFTFDELKGENGTAVLFICNHCPFVIHVMDELVRIVNSYKTQGIGFIIISSNDVINYPQDNPENMQKFATKYELDVPYLYDKSQEVAKAYDAACTPDISVFDSSENCIYRGQMDGSRPGNAIENNGIDLRKVLDYTIANKPIDFTSFPSVGCNIKWK